MKVDDSLEIFQIIAYIITFVGIVIVPYYLLKWCRELHSYFVRLEGSKRNKGIIQLGLFSAGILIIYAFFRIWGGWDSDTIPDALLVVLISVPVAWGLWVWRNKDKTESHKLENLKFLNEKLTAYTDVFLRLTSIIKTEQDTGLVSMAIEGLRPYLWGDRGETFIIQTVHVLKSAIKNKYNQLNVEIDQVESTEKKKCNINTVGRERATNYDIYWVIVSLAKVLLYMNKKHTEMLSGISLKYLTFEHDHFTAYVRYSYFHKNYFKDCTFDEFTYNDSNIFGDEFHVTTFHGSKFIKVTFSGVRFIGCVIANCHFKSCTFDNCFFDDITFAESLDEASNFSDCTLKSNCYLAKINNPPKNFIDLIQKYCDAKQIDINTIISTNHE